MITVGFLPLGLSIHVVVLPHRPFGFVVVAIVVGRILLETDYRQTILRLLVDFHVARFENDYNDYCGF